MILLYILLNAIMGALVWSLMDHDKRLFEWYSSAPGGFILRPTLQFLVLELWPIGLLLLIRRECGN